MASVINDPNGRRRLQFTDPNGRRQTIRLGKMPKRTAESVKTYVEHLLIAQLSKRPVDGETAKWVASLDDVLSERLAKVGLIQERRKESCSHTLGGFLDAYIESRVSLKPNTKRNYETTRRHLVGHFGRGRALADISPGDADEWREILLKRLAAATVNREVKRAKQFFRAAVRKRLLAENPFADISTPAQVNKSRQHFIDLTTIEKVIDACPDAEWRLIVALSRYGGLRCPSEHLAMTWGDMDWEHDRMTVRSPKTEHHPGGESRLLPLFPELKPFLEAAFDEAEPGTKYVITRNRDRNCNLRTQLLRIIKRAGVEHWPKLFHNLRATRQTELAEKYPAHVVCAWLGNSQVVAMQHYLQTTEEHFRKAAQNPTQPVHESGCQPMTTKQKTPQLSGKNVPDNAGQLLNMRLVPPRGVEPLSPP